MSNTALAYWRFIIPGVFLYGLLALLCWTTSWCSLALPESYQEITKLLGAVALAVVYRFFPLREFSNGPFHARVNANIRELLGKPFQQTIPEAKSLPWKKMRVIFYYFVDKDPSLKTQSENIRFNGLLWTSVADLRVVAMIGIGLLCVIAIAVPIYPAAAFDEGRLLLPMIGLWLLLGSSYYASHVLTEKHRKLGENQCDVIIAQYKSELAEKLNAAIKESA